jgi:uncharacterized protein
MAELRPLDASDPQLQELDAEEARAWERLGEILITEKSWLIAFSGGVDSALIIEAAYTFLESGKVLGVIAKSETLTDSEFENAVELANQRNWPLETIEYSELSIPSYAENPVNRCYFCRQELFGRLTEVAKQRGLVAVADGTNASDGTDYRPGMKAKNELGVRSPLAEAGIEKEMVRRLAKKRGLPVWDKPSGACLSSRIPYGMEITPERLSMVEQGEAFLHEMGFLKCRVRHNDATCRIEVDIKELPRLVEPEIRKQIVEHFQQIGYKYISLDLEGYRTGSMNKVLNTNK